MLPTLDPYSLHVIIYTLSMSLVLLYISYVDLKKRIIPDKANIILFLIGALFLITIKPEVMISHLLSSVFGFLLFFTINLVYLYLNKRDALGGGDAKLFAACGIWVGFEGLMSILFYASLSGLLFSSFYFIYNKNISAKTYIAFAPHLCLGLWLTWVFGPVQFYI